MNANLVGGMMRHFFITLVTVLSLCIAAGCNSAAQELPAEVSQSAQDASCRQTIQKLYSLETYCPNNLEALRQLYTENFVQYYQPSLDRCNDDISSYRIVSLLSQNDADFPHIYNPYPASAPDTLVYYAVVEIEMKSVGRPVPSPASLWLSMRVDESGDCKVDQISGGG
ncbi:MAG: hypothetical protein HY867_03785 [Chloroflexi bacterium]|nr:hypothetical protein [Chloroflexota bacterium]